MYSDPFLGVFDYSFDTESEERFKKYRDKLLLLSHDKNFGYIFNTLAALCDVLSVKYGLGIKTRELYRKCDKKALADLVDTDYSSLIKKLENLYQAFLFQWDRECKSNGFEVHDIRFGGMIRRAEHCKEMIIAYVEGKIPAITPLEEDILPAMKEAKKGEGNIGFNSWMYTAMIKPLM